MNEQLKKGDIARIVMGPLMGLLVRVAKLDNLGLVHFWPLEERAGFPRDRTYVYSPEHFDVLSADALPDFRDQRALEAWLSA